MYVWQISPTRYLLHLCSSYFSTVPSSGTFFQDVNIMFCISMGKWSHPSFDTISNAQHLNIHPHVHFVCMGCDSLANPFYVHDNHINTAIQVNQTMTIFYIQGHTDYLTYIYFVLYFLLYTMHTSERLLLSIFPSLLHIQFPYTLSFHSHPFFLSLFPPLLFYPSPSLVASII